MRKSPAFTVVAVLTLALGIGANTAIFTMMSGLMLHTLPVRDPGQLVEILHHYPDDPEPGFNGFSLDAYQIMRDGNHVLSDLIYMHFHPQDMDHGTMSDADFQDWEAQNQSFEAPGLFYEGAIFEITGKTEPELVSGAVVTPGFFSTLGQRPLLGRVFLPADEKMGSNDIVVLSEGLWRRLFNSSPEAIGQSLHMKLRGTDGYQNRGSEPQVTNIGP